MRQLLFPLLLGTSFAREELFTRDSSFEDLFLKISLDRNLFKNKQFFSSFEQVAKLYHLGSAICVDDLSQGSEVSLRGFIFIQSRFAAS